MPVDGLVTDDEGRAGGRDLVLWLPVGFLIGIWLWLVFSSGGYPVRNWVFPALAVGALGLVAGSLVAYPRRPRQLSLVGLALFGSYSLWILASNLWAGSTSAA